jgi:hypothetical protein
MMFAQHVNHVKMRCQILCCIDIVDEINYYKHGGILLLVPLNIARAA